MLRVQLNTKDLNELILTLKSMRQGAVDKILTRAINRTATMAKTEIARGLRDATGIRYGSVLERIDLQEATYEKKQALMAISHRRLSLMHFHARQTKQGVRFTTSKLNPDTLAESAFITRGAHDTEGVFIRRRGLWRKTTNQYVDDPSWWTRHGLVKPDVFAPGMRPKKYVPRKYAPMAGPVRKDQRVPRYPIDLLRGPSLWQVFTGIENLAESAIANANQRLVKHVWDQVDLMFARSIGKSVRRQKGAA